LKYRIFFEFFGKKYQKDFTGFSQFDAEEQLRELIDIHEVRLIEGNEESDVKDIDANESLEFLKNMFGMK